MSETGADPRPEICDGFCMDGCEVDELAWRFNRALRWAWNYRRLANGWRSINDDQEALLRQMNTDMATACDDLDASEQVWRAAIAERDAANLAVSEMEATLAQASNIATADFTALRAALAKYGRHLDSCNTILAWGLVTTEPCDCGLRAALEER